MGVSKSIRSSFQPPRKLNLLSSCYVLGRDLPVFRTSAGAILHCSSSRYDFRTLYRGRVFLCGGRLSNRDSGCNVSFMWPLWHSHSAGSEAGVAVCLRAASAAPVTRAPPVFLT
uniref:Uncharacterized protein n=1 Tax=Schistocephalus solidus TaxID=70667 RepID=A0A0X3NJ76_SCHSO